MSKEKDSCDCLHGVGCDVHNCIYNDTSCSLCRAERINVQNKVVENKTEAACETYSPKSTM